MRTITTLALLATLSLPGALARADARAAGRTVLQEIEARHARGEIDRETLHRLRVLAIRRPAALPADLRALAAAAPVKSGTRYLVEAFQHILATQAWGGDLHALLQPPADLTYTIESTRWPIRVSYSSTSQAAYAQAVLEAADLSYDVQIGEWGFHQPPLEPGYEPFRIYVDDTGSQSTLGYTAPYDVVPDSTRVACYTYVVVTPSLSVATVGATVAHELSHTMQAAMDCIEPSTFWENTAMYAEAYTRSDWLDGAVRYFPGFQTTPWRSLDYFASGSLYPYGGWLWLLYLADRIAPEDGPVFVREIWEAAMQPGSINEPDYFDAITTAAAARGAPVSDLETLYTDFAEARYFVGANDDGAHLPDAALYEGAEPTVSARHTLSDLPIVDEEPPSAERPSAFGTSYVRLDLTGGAARPLIVGVDGASTTRWAARVLLMGGGQPTEAHDLTIDPANGAGQVTVDTEGFAELLLVVVNLGPAGYDPDNQAWAGSSYYYRIEPVKDPPLVSAVYPGAVRRGQQNLRVRLTGANFVYGPGFEIQLSDPAMDVVSIDSLTDTEVLFTLTVPAGATVGPKDILVTNPDGQQGSAEGLFAVVDEFDTLEPEPMPDGGCRTASGPLPSAPFALGFLLALLVLRRRRR